MIADITSFKGYYNVFPEINAAENIKASKDRLLMVNT